MSPGQSKSSDQSSAVFAKMGRGASAGATTGGVGTTSHSSAVASQLAASGSNKKHSLDEECLAANQEISR